MFICQEEFLLDCKKNATLSVRLRVEMQPTSSLTVFKLEQSIVLPSTKRGARLPPTHMNYRLCAEIRENKRGGGTEYITPGYAPTTTDHVLLVWLINKFPFESRPFLVFTFLDQIRIQLNANVGVPVQSGYFYRTRGLRFRIVRVHPDLNFEKNFNEVLSSSEHSIIIPLVQSIYTYLYSCIPTFGGLAQPQIPCASRRQRIIYFQF